MRQNTINLQVKQASKEDIIEAHAIPALGHKEAGKLAKAELECTLDRLESLSGDDWSQPTACTLWDVRDMAAHLAGACAGFASWQQFKRLYLQNPYIREAEMAIDGINRLEVEDRAGDPPEEIIAELREVGPRAIRTRQRLPWLLRSLPIPFGPPLGTVPVGYLTDLIYIRDMWMHRVDICFATGRSMTFTPGHDDRIVALVVRDLEKKLRGQLKKPLLLVLTGPAGGVYRFGQGEPAAEIRMDALQFNNLASERMTTQEAQAHVQIQGDRDLANGFLEQTEVPY